MTNTLLIATLSAKFARIIKHRMNDIGDSYEEARAYAAGRSVAGPAVWAVIDAEFSNN